MAADTCVIVYAKAPVPGQVKTRLAPALDAASAALLHAALVERALQTAQAAQLSGVVLCCAPDASHVFFETCAEDFAVDLADQGEGDLGARMLCTLQQALEGFDAAIIIGADAPAVTAKHLREAANALTDVDVVLSPAEDGGYVLIGARRTHPAMFEGIEWGSEKVLEQQRQALLACGLGWKELDTLWDVDRPEDLPRLKALRPPLAFFWP